MELEEVSILNSHQQPDNEENAALTTLPKFPCTFLCAHSEQENATIESKQRSKSARKLFGLVIFCVLAMVVEIVGGLKANSLAVITDAGHLLTDIAGLLVSLSTLWASGWQATSYHSYGYYRLEVMGALLNVQLIWLISGILVYEAIDRIIHKHEEVDGKLMFLVAVFGFIINLIMVLWLGHDHSHHSCGGHHHYQQHHSHEVGDTCIVTEEEETDLVLKSSNRTKILNINLQGAYLHAISDMIQSIGVMIAGAVIWAKPHWLVVDLLCTLLFSFIVLGTTLSMLRNVFSILMNMTPGEIDVSSLEDDLRNIKGVEDIHDVHIWSITVGKLVLTCHVTAAPGAPSSDILKRITDYCKEVYGIDRVTVQVE